MISQVLYIVVGISVQVLLESPLDPRPVLLYPPPSSMVQWRQLACLLCHLALACVCDAAVHVYQGQKWLEGEGNALVFQGGREGLYASTEDALTHWNKIPKGVANGKSYIRFETLRFERPAEVAARHSPTLEHTGLVQAVVFELGDLKRLGIDVLSKGGVRRRKYCCSPDIEKEAQCELGKVIVRPRAGDNQLPRVLPIDFLGNDTVAEPVVGNGIHIKEKGMYYLWFFICDRELKGVTIRGKTTWKNPTGYLPGMMAPLLPFYGAMSIAYLLLGFLWFLQYMRFWRDILQLQNCITLVVFLGMCEMATWYFDYVNFNMTGSRPYGITVWAVVLGALRKTVSRLLILVVAMGFGVVRPTLGGLSGKVVGLGCGYMVASLALDVISNVGAIDDLTSSERIILVLPVAILDAIFILWIFTSLSKTLALLQTKKASHKLDLYRKFTNALALSVVVSIAWIGYEMYSKVSDKYNENWQNDWIMAGFWHILTFILLTVICILWAPSQNSTRYAYSEDVADDADEETIALTTTKEGSTPGKGPAAGQERKPVNTDVFSLEDDVEEGKLE